MGFSTSCHIHAGLAIYLLFQTTLGWRRGSLLVLALLAFLVAGEESLRIMSGEWQPGRAIADLALTLLWPTLLHLGSFYRRRRWQVARIRAGRKWTSPLMAGVPRPHPPRLRVFTGYAANRS